MRIFKVAKKSVTKTKTEADPETRDYDTMDNDMVDDEDLYRQFCVNRGEQANNGQNLFFYQVYGPVIWLKYCSVLYKFSRFPRCMTREIMTIW